jgi:hypothetical protein
MGIDLEALRKQLRHRNMESLHALGKLSQVARSKARGEGKEAWTKIELPTLSPTLDVSAAHDGVNFAEAIIPGMIQ